MNFKLVLFSTACLCYFVIPAAGTNLLAASVGGNGVFIEAGLTGTALSSSIGGENVVIQAKPGTIAVEAVPAQEIVVQQPVVQYKPVHPISLVPVATVSSSYSIMDKLSSVWGGVSNVINAKTKAVGDFLRSLRGPPRIVMMNVEKPTTTTTTTHRPPLLEIVALPRQRVFPFQPMPVLIEDCDKK